MIAGIRIRKKQLKKLENLIKEQKLAFEILEGSDLQPFYLNDPDYLVLLNVKSGNPGDLFTLGEKFNSIRDTISM